MCKCYTCNKESEGLFCYSCRHLIDELQDHFGLVRGRAIISVREACGDRIKAGHLAIAWNREQKKRRASEDVEETVVTKEGKRVRKPRKPVVVDRNKLTSEEYRELEYDFLELDGSMTFKNKTEALRYYQELMDVALIGKDIEWAKEIHQQIKNLEGAIH